MSISFYRALFYTLAGIVSAIIGWFFSQLFLVDLGQFFIKDALLFNPDFILLPVVGACLAMAMVATEIFLSNPTRYRANRRVLPPYFWGALATGALAGLISAICTSLLYRTGTPSGIVRVVAWSLVGFFTGLGESLSWRLRSIESSSSQANQRIRKAILFGFGAGFGAAVLVEILRSGMQLGGYEDPAGFLVLGLMLGLSLSFATAPTYQVALRAGKGFEPPPSQALIVPKSLPELRNSLRFVTTKSRSALIEEGLSIKLPSQTTSPIIIGSGDRVDIYIPNIPEECAGLEVKNRQVTLTCWVQNKVQIQNLRMNQGDPKTLIHNQIITFYHENENRQPNEEEDTKLYRVVFYDRFLDPQA
ncbi:MAG: hypothetical protein WCD53_03320 [Microcoleus sp.]